VNKIIFITSIAMVFFLLITSHHPSEFFTFGIFAPSMFAFIGINYQMKINRLGQFVEELLG